MSASSKKKLRKEQNAASMTEKQIQANKEAKKLKRNTIIFVVALALVVCIAVGAFVYNRLNGSSFFEKNTTAAIVGDHKLSPAELNYFYIDYLQKTYAEWYNTYSTYTDTFVASMMGLDPTKPLDEQVYDKETGETWADYYGEMAARSARDHYAVYDIAKANGYTLSEVDQTTIDTTIKNYETFATWYGVSTDEYLEMTYGKGADVESFRKYLEVTTISQAYYNEYADSLTYAKDTLSAYEADGHYQDFSTYSFAAALIPYTDFLPESETGEYTNDEITIALMKAEEAANTVLASGVSTLEELSDAVANLEVYAEAEDISATSSGEMLGYEINPLFIDWLGEEGRQVGDSAVIANVVENTDADGNVVSAGTEGYFVVVLESIDTNDINLVNIHHIQLNFENGTTDTTTGVTTYTDDEKKAKLEAITEIQDTWIANGGGLEAFKALVAENTVDEVSAENGGLYEDIYPGQLVDAPNLDDWCFDEDRTAGDYGIIETDYGYHLVYFAGESETTYREHLIEEYLRTTDLETWYAETVGSIKYSVKSIKRLNLDYIMSTSSYY